MDTEEEPRILVAGELGMDDVRDTKVSSMIFEGIHSVLIGFSNGVRARLYPADDHWAGFVGETVSEIVHSKFGKFFFLRIKFSSGRIGLFRI